MGSWVNAAEVWRGEFLECVHRGRAVVCNSLGEVVASFGDVDATILPRSSVKMLQALPLIESGAADRFKLQSEHLAVACASHQGAAIHTDLVSRWLQDLGFGEQDLLCGPQFPREKQARIEVVLSGRKQGKRHNNCSGKHSGFLCLSKHFGADAEYLDMSHPVQKAVLQAFEEMTGETSPGYGIDGCSAPNHACSLKGLATAMARMAAPSKLGKTRQHAAEVLTTAMKRHPELVAGEGRACTELMHAMAGATVVKTGAEGVFTAILPELGLGVAVKIEDGATRGAECAMAALLVRLGVADENHPLVEKRLQPVQTNYGGLTVGQIRPAQELFENGSKL